ncbi:MAG TPA: hypothetical protein VMM83_06280 [Longimicrobiales bacterium]|nr:hypothetical protein [Longimicrobiales bacterium]
MRIIPFLLPPLLLAACEAGGGTEETPATGREEFGPTAAYDRRLVFLGPGAELPTAAVFDFAVLSDSATLRRGIRVRLVDGVEWIPLMDAGWEMERMREPWRLLPHGDLKVIVGSAGELDALVLAGEELRVRLDPGSSIAEYSPDAGTQLVLRQAELRLGGEPIAGILLDAQLGRAVNPSAIPPATTEASGEEGGQAEEPGEDAEGDYSLVVDPAPAARAGAEALLLDNAGYYVVFAASAEGDIAWVHAAGRDDIRRAARLEPLEWEPFEEAGVQVPIAWRVRSPGDLLGGELRSEAADRAVLGEGAGIGAMGYVVVTGWIEDRGVRRNVYGLVRHVR